MELQTLIPASPRDGSRVTDSFPPRVPVQAQRILVADDDECIRRFISIILAGDGFDVTAASDGEQAWEELLREHYDLLVTDNGMPRLTGMKLIERIREAGMSLPVIIVSGSLPAERVRDCPQLQIAAVIPKPFDIWEFANTVRNILREFGGKPAADHGAFHQLHASPQPIR